MSDESKPALTDAEQLAALRAAIAVVLKPRTLELLGHLARGQRSPDELLIVLDAENSRARAASRGYAVVGRYDLALGERDRAGKISTVTVALRHILELNFAPNELDIVQPLR